MALHRKLIKTGGSLSVTIPRDVAEIVGLVEGSEVRFTTINRQIVLEPTDDTAPDEVFRRAYASVLRKYGPAFEGLAAFDAGRRKRGSRRSTAARR